MPSALKTFIRWAWAQGFDVKHPLAHYMRLQSSETRYEPYPESRSKYVPHQGARERARRLNHG